MNRESERERDRGESDVDRRINKSRGRRHYDTGSDANEARVLPHDSGAKAR